MTWLWPFLGGTLAGWLFAGPCQSLYHQADAASYRRERDRFRWKLGEANQSHASREQADDTSKDGAAS